MGFKRNIYNMKSVYLVMRRALPVIGILIGMVKIVGLGIEVRVFESFGGPDWFRVVFGVVQVACSAFLIIKPLEVIGIAGNIVLFILAASLMTYHHMFDVLIAPVVGLIILVIYAFLRHSVLGRDS